MTIPTESREFMEWLLRPRYVRFPKLFLMLRDMPAKKRDEPPHDAG